MATTFDAILRIGARVQGVGDVRALSAAMRQVADETRQVAALERAQANLARVLLDNQKAAAATERERAAFATQRLQLSLKVAETEYAATIKQLAAQKELQAAQVKAAADRVRAADAAMKQALVTTNEMRSEKKAAEENLRVQIQKAKAQYESIGNLKQIAQLEHQATIAAAQGAEAANRRAQATASKAKADAQTFAAFREMDRETQRRQTEAVKVQAASQQRMLEGMQSVKSMALGAAAALGAFSAVQVGGNIIAAGQEAELTRRRINAVAGGLGEVAGVYAIAARGANEFAIANIDSQVAVANLYNRLRPMGVSLEQIETVYNGVNKAVLLGGLSSYDATEAFRQLSQAMGSGRLQGDELRSLMERMPAIGVALAKVLNVSVGEIKKLGADGKLTTDVIIKATQELAKLQPPEPTPVQRYTAAVKDLSTALGEELLPQITPTIQGLTSLVNSFAKNTEHIMDVVALPSIGLAKIFAGLMGVIRGEPEVALAEWRKIDEIAQQAKIGAINRKLAEEGAATAIGNYSASAVAAVAAARQAANVASEKAAAEAAVEETKNRQVKLEKEILEAERQAVALVDVQFQQVERINNAAAARAEGMRDMAQQTLSVEEAQIDVARAILDQKMGMATSDQERLSITRQIAELDRQAAQANYAATMAQIKAEQQLEKIRVMNAENNFVRARSAYDIAVKFGTLTADIANKLESARNELRASAVQNVATERSLAAKGTVAGYQLQVANIRSNTAVSQAMQQPLVKNFGMPIATGNNFLEINGRVLSGVPQFAKGGHAKGPTLALIGEGGEGESVVPDSKRLGFAINVLRGITGAAAIPAFAKGGYIAGENPANRGWVTNYQRRGSYPILDEYSRLVAIAAQRNKSSLGLEIEKNQIARELGLSPGVGDKPFMVPNSRGFGTSWRRNGQTGSTGKMSFGTIRIEPKVTPMPDGQMWAPQTEIERVALVVATQAIGANNAKQRQPSVRRRGRR
jgi:tape measure domain-containing protein